MFDQCHSRNIVSHIWNSCEFCLKSTTTKRCHKVPKKLKGVELKFGQCPNKPGVFSLELSFVVLSVGNDSENLFDMSDQILPFINKSDFGNNSGGFPEMSESVASFRFWWSCFNICISCEKWEPWVIQHFHFSYVTIFTCQWFRFSYNFLKIIWGKFSLNASVV